MKINGTNGIAGGLTSLGKTSGEFEKPVPKDRTEETDPSPAPHPGRLEAHRLEEGQIQRTLEVELQARIDHAQLKSSIVRELSRMGKASLETQVDMLASLYPRDDSIKWKEFRALLLAGFDLQEDPALSREQFESLIGAAQARVYLGEVLQDMYRSNPG